MTDFTPSHKPGSGPPLLQREKRPGPSAMTILLIIQSGFSGLLLGLAVFNLTTETGTLANLKSLALAASATVVTFAINRFAIEQGADFAAKGFKSALVWSVASILATGLASAAATFSGLTIKDVASRIYQDQGLALATFAGQIVNANARLSAVAATLKAVSTEQTAVAECERASSCMSRQGEGGRGPVAKALEALPAKTNAVLALFEAGQAEAQKILITINALLADYNKVFARTDIDIWQKESELKKIHAKIDQQAAAMATALPLSLLRSFKADLAKGIAIPERPDAASRVNAMLAKQSEALEGVLAGLPRNDWLVPAFPARPGVLDTLRYVGEFLSIAGIVLIAEAMLPISLWLYAYLTNIWFIESTRRFDTATFAPEPPSPRALPPAPGSVPIPPPSQAPDLDVVEVEVVAPRRRGRPPGKRP